jgi:hypothetical protein
MQENQAYCIPAFLTISGLGSGPEVLREAPMSHSQTLRAT